MELNWKFPSNYKMDAIIHDDDVIVRMEEAREAQRGDISNYQLSTFY